jgi:hypothetical protein
MPLYSFHLDRRLLPGENPRIELTDEVLGMTFAEFGLPGLTGFRRDFSGNFVLLSVPVAHDGTRPIGVKLQRKIAGWYFYANFSLPGLAQ